MTAILFLATYYPFWALPMALICGELSWYFFKRRQRAKMAVLLIVGMIFFSSVVIWVFFDGYKTLVPKFREFIAS